MGLRQVEDVDIISYACTVGGIVIGPEYFRAVRLSRRLCRFKRACIHRRDAKDAEINVFLFAVERTAKRNYSV
jgi:maleate cis-trans isomerase